VNFLESCGPQAPEMPAGGRFAPAGSITGPMARWARRLKPDATHGAIRGRTPRRRASASAVAEPERLRRARAPSLPRAPSPSASASAERGRVLGPPTPSPSARRPPPAEPERLRQAPVVRLRREAPARHCNQRLWIRTCFHTSVGCILCGKPAVKNNDREYFVKIISPYSISANLLRR
jgi:hypothetical protein